jgi:integrase
MTDIILKQNSRILFPSDYQKLREHMPRYYQLICDANLLSGMRPVELSRFSPDWYRASRRVIQLPIGACLKQRAKYKARTITLSLAGCDALDKLVSEKIKHKGKEVFAYQMIPQRVAFRDALIRYATLAGIETRGINPKMFRKTLVSWLIACYPEKQAYIQASMGHDGDTIVNNYLGVGFTREQMDEMRSKYLNDWGVVV